MPRGRRDPTLVLTGLMGVGGGFVIVPALIATLGLTTPIAIGTSQLVVLVNAVAGLVGRSIGTTSIVWTVGVPFSLGGVIGAGSGSMVADRFSSRTLQYAFAGVAALAAVAMILDSFR